MGSSVNGMAAHGGVIPFGCDLPGLLRLHAARHPPGRALGHLKSIFVFTHDSIAVGEDGPTHEPVEHVMSLRLIPDLTVHPPRRRQRNGRSLEDRDQQPDGRPCSSSPARTADPRSQRRNGDASRGWLRPRDTDGDPDVVLMAPAPKSSSPSWPAEILAESRRRRRASSACRAGSCSKRQGAEWKANVLGAEGTPRVSVEAGSPSAGSATPAPMAPVSASTATAHPARARTCSSTTASPREHVAATALRLLGRDDRGRRARRRIHRRAASWPEPQPSRLRTDIPDLTSWQAIDRCRKGRPSHDFQHHQATPHRRAEHLAGRHLPRHAPSGMLQQRIDEIGIRGVTSNPTIFEKAIAAATPTTTRSPSCSARTSRSPRSSRRSRSRTSGTPAISSARSTTSERRRRLRLASKSSPSLARDAEGTLDQRPRLWTPSTART